MAGGSPTSQTSPVDSRSTSSRSAELAGSGRFRPKVVRNLCGRQTAKELFYRIGAKMMAVDVTTEQSFSAGPPRLLFEKPFFPPTIPTGTSSVSPDGQRFLMLQPVDQTQPATEINVVLNWAEELKRLVPVKP